MKVKKAIIFLFLVVLLVCGIYGIQYLLSIKTLKVNFNNIDKVFVYKTKDIEGSKEAVPIYEIRSSGEEIKLRRGSYTLQYNASENYQDRFVEVDLVNNNQVVDLFPKYTDEYLDGLLSGELKDINRVITNKYPKVNGLYHIQKGRLYKEGEWYGTVLVYKGKDVYKTDSLRLVMKKENNKWVLKTNPPTILITSTDYPEIPVDILRDVNTLPTSSSKQ